MLDDHRRLAARTIRLMLTVAAVIAVALLAVRRVDAMGGLAAGVAVGVADVLLLARSLTRFGRTPGMSATALGAAMFTRFLTIGALLGLMLCVHGLSPVATLLGFLLMPASVGVVGVADALRRQRIPRTAP